MAIYEAIHSGLHVDTISGDQQDIENDIFYILGIIYAQYYKDVIGT